MVVYSEKIGKAVTVTFSRREREAQEWLGKQVGVIPVPYSQFQVVVPPFLTQD
jgi:hypothetical protein